jgi:hypothetical protein
MGDVLVEPNPLRPALAGQAMRALRHGTLALAAPVEAGCNMCCLRIEYFLVISYLPISPPYCHFLVIASLPRIAYKRCLAWIPSAGKREGTSDTWTRQLVHRLACG